MTNRQGQMLCIVGFAVSRAVYLGRLRLRFDESPLTYFLQYIDPQLLKHNLLESLLYLHSQPPGFNWFLGVVLKVFPASHAVAFQVVFLSLGLLFALSLFTLMAELGVPAWGSAVLTLIFSSSPAALWYENWLFYTYPTAALLCLSSAILYRFAVNAALPTGFAFFAVLALVASIRGIFHLIWFGFFCFFVFYILKDRRHQVARAFFLPLVGLSALYARNYLLFGSVSTGDIYAALNLKVMSYYKLPPDEHRRLIEQGTLTRMSLIPGDAVDDALDHIESFLDLAGRREKTGVAVLDQIRKSTGAINFNNIALVGAAKLISKDNTYFLRNRPGVYLHAVIRAYRFYVLPAGETRRFNRLKDRLPGIRLLDRQYCLLLLGEWTPGGPAYVLVFGCPVLLAFGFYAAAKARARGDVATFITLAFVVANVLYVTLVTTFLSEGDHNRYRFKVDAFYVTLLGLLISSSSAVVKAAWVRRKGV